MNTGSQNLIEEFTRIKSGIVQADNSIIENLEEEYNRKWKGTVCDGYMVEYINFLRDTLTQKRKEWLSKNVLSVKESIAAMTISQCVQWQSTKSELPDFLTDEDLEEVNALSVLITEKIKAQKINGIIELYVALSDEERAECLHKLQEIH